MPSKFHRMFHRELESGLRGPGAKSQRRTLAEIRGVNLCSNDYLGLARHPGLQIAAAEAVREASRVGGTRSRFLSCHAQAGNELEETSAQFVGTEEALGAAEYLPQEGFAVRAIRPPTVPAGSARLRFSPTCKIAADEIRRLDRALGAWREQSHVPASASATATAGRT